MPLQGASRFPICARDPRAGSDKVLAQMAYEDIESFNELAAIAKKDLEA